MCILIFNENTNIKIIDALLEDDRCHHGTDCGVKRKENAIEKEDPMFQLCFLNLFLNNLEANDAKCSDVCMCI
jgi:hypothetical protein